MSDFPSAITRSTASEIRSAASIARGSLALASEPFEQHLARHDERVGIGDVLAGDVGRRAVRGLRHRLPLADAKTGRETQPTDEAGALVGQDIPELIGRDDHVVAPRIHHELHREAVHQRFIVGHVRILCRDLAALLGEHAAGETVHGLFVNGRDLPALARPRDVECGAGDAIRAFARDHASGDRDLVVGPELRGAGEHRFGRLKAFGDFAQKDDIDVLVQRLHVRVRLDRLHARIEVEALAKRRHDPGRIVARIRIVADRAAQPAVGLLQRLDRVLRHRVAVRFMRGAAEREDRAIRSRGRSCAAAAFMTLTASGTTSSPMSSPARTPIFSIVASHSHAPIMARVCKRVPR